MTQKQIPAAVADAGRVRMGAGIRMAPKAVADSGRVRSGAGIRLAPRAR